LEITRFRIVRGRLEPRREMLAAPGPGEVIVRVEGCALGEAEVQALGREGACPGASSVGRVEAGVADWTGRRVLVPEALPCGECAVCQRGRGPACPQAVRPGENVPGALATHLLVPVRFLVPADRELAPPTTIDPWRLAALCGPAARAYQMMVRAGLGPGELALFIGDTPEAHLGAAIARLKGAQAAMLGLTDPPPETEARIWRIFETTRRAGGALRAAELCPPTGSLSLLGSAGPDVPRLLEVPVLTTLAPHPDLLVELLALVVRGELDLGAPCAPVPPDDLESALCGLLEGAGVPCPIFVP
jgi:hypothetical protein